MALFNFESPYHCRDDASFSSLHYVLLVVLFGFQNYNVALWHKDATEQTKRRSENRKDVHSHSVFPSCAHINRDESNPHSKEYEHAEGDELGLVKIIR